MYHISDDKRSRESSSWIYNALEEMMQEQEYKTIKITDLCNRAKVGRVTFYRHFDSIDDVLRMKCDEKFDGLVEFVTDYRKYNTEPPFFIKPFLRYWYVNAGILRIIFKAGKDTIIHESFARMVDKVKNVLQPESVDMENRNYLLAIRSALSVTIIKEWIKNDMNIAPDDLTQILVEQMRWSIDMNMLL